MLLLNDFNRFSVDIDILMPRGSENTIKNIIFQMKCNKFIRIEEDLRRSVDIIKRHFKFYYKSIYIEDESYILLDVVFENFSYVNIQNLTIESHFVKTTDPFLTVKVPSVEEMLGDKLTAFAPRTIGILFIRPNQFRSKHIEIIKQLYDIAKLSTKITDINMVRKTYINIANIQIQIRNINIDYKECLKDTIETCKLILSEGKYGGKQEEYLLLKKGYEGFKNYVVSNFLYQDLLIIAARVYILSINLLFDKKSLVEERPINTFVGKKWKYLRQQIGIDLYSELMKSAFVENNKLVLNNN